MTGRTIRDGALDGLAHWLVRHGHDPGVVSAEVLELEQILVGHGVVLPRTVRREEPDAHWSDRPEPGTASADYRAARRELRLSRAQLTAEDFQVLKAADAGTLECRFDPGAALVVWVTGDGRNLTAAAVALEGRGLLARAGADEAGRVAGRLTEPGRRIWEDLGELATADADGGE